MHKSPSVVLMTFGGRHDRMALLKHYVDNAIQQGIVDEWHVWNCARVEVDNVWLMDTFPVIRLTADDLAYRLTSSRVPAVNEHVLRFDVRAGHDAHIAFIPDGGGQSYELVLGAWGNSRAAMRVWPPGKLPDHSVKAAMPDLMAMAPGALSARIWRSVEVAFTREGTSLAIVARIEGRDVLRLDAHEPSPSPFNVAVMSGFGNGAEWRFEQDRAQQTGLFFPTFSPRFHPWNPVYHYYAARAAEYTDTVFLKCDDDIVYLDPARLADFIRFRRERPDYFLVSANVVNNGVCAHVQQQLGMLPSDFCHLELPPGGFRGSLWESGAKAEALHHCFLSDPGRFGASPRTEFELPEIRISINFVSWMGSALPYFDTRFADDEQDLTVTLPAFLGRRNAIYLPFVASHLSFGVQDAHMGITGLLDKYWALAGALVGAPAETKRRTRMTYRQPAIPPAGARTLLTPPAPPRSAPASEAYP